MRSWAQRWTENDTLCFYGRDRIYWYMVESVKAQQQQGAKARLSIEALLALQDLQPYDGLRHQKIQPLCSIEPTSGASCESVRVDAGRTDI